MLSTAEADGNVILQVFAANWARSGEQYITLFSFFICVCVCVDEELQSEDELDKELLWNLQLLSEVRQDLWRPKGFNTLKNINPTHVCHLVCVLKCYVISKWLKSLHVGSAFLLDSITDRFFFFKNFLGLRCHFLTATEVICLFYLVQGLIRCYYKTTE